MLHLAIVIVNWKVIYISLFKILGFLPFITTIKIK